MIPHYEMQGNHDTSMDTRFFRSKMRHTQSLSGERVYYIAFFTHYGGYPLIPYEIVGNYDAYRSYGRLSDETVAFVEESACQTRAEGAAQIVLLCHFSIARELKVPILPETGLGKLAAICKKYNIRLYFSGHEHNPKYSLYKLGSVYDYDAATTKDRCAVVEIRRHSATVTIYNTDDGAVYRVDHPSGAVITSFRHKSRTSFRRGSRDRPALSASRRGDRPSARSSRERMAVVVRAGEAQRAGRCVVCADCALHVRQLVDAVIAAFIPRDESPPFKNWKRPYRRNGAEDCSHKKTPVAPNAESGRPASFVSAVCRRRRCRDRCTAAAVRRKC